MLRGVTGRPCCRPGGRRSFIHRERGRITMRRRLVMAVGGILAVAAVGTAQQAVMMQQQPAQVQAMPQYRSPFMVSAQPALAPAMQVAAQPAMTQPVQYIPV